MKRVMKTKYLLSLFILAMTLFSCNSEKKSKAHYYKPELKSNVRFTSSTYEETENMMLASNNISLSIMVSKPDEVITENASNYLNSKITEIVTTNGIGSVGGNPVLVLAATLNRLESSLTSTSPTINKNKYCLTLHVGNVLSNEIYGTYITEIIGVGRSHEQALINAISNVKNSNEIQKFLSTSTSKIINYYEYNSDKIIAYVNKLIATGLYNEAFLYLSAIPKESKRCYDYAQKNIASVTNLVMKSYEETLLINMKDAILNANNEYHPNVAGYYRLIPSDSRLKKEADNLFTEYTQKVGLSLLEKQEREEYIEREKMAQKRIELEIQSRENMRLMNEQANKKNGGFAEILNLVWQIGKTKIVKFLL